MINNYVRIDRVIEKINRFKIPGGYWNPEEIKEWTYDALSAINDKSARVKAITQVEVIDNKAKIPADVDSIASIYDDETKNRLEEVLPNRDLGETTYLLNGGFIYTKLKNPTGNGRLTIDYYTVPLDEDGNPLIPDNRYYLSAVEAFLQYMIGRRAYYSGKILQQQYIALEQEWHFCLPAAIASQKMDIMKDPNRFARIHNKHLL